MRISTFILIGTEQLNYCSLNCLDVFMDLTIFFILFFGIERYHLSFCKVKIHLIKMYNKELLINFKRPKVCFLYINLNVDS